MGAAHRLDVLIATHNRAARLEKCVRSVLVSARDATLDTHVTVICNGCTDSSVQVVEKLRDEFPKKVSVIDERRKGKSRALNAGISATSGDLVGMVDDDEEVHPAWVETIAAAFEDPELEFIGGPYLPVWAAPPPDWLPDDYLAVLGSVDNGSTPRSYDRSFPGILKGGNAVIRRTTLARVGPYAEYLGPGSFARLFSCEDEDMYLRLLEAGAVGKYLPDLVIYHYIDEHRLTREYYRSWCFWRGVSLGLMDPRHPLPVTYLAGVPRFLWGRAARSLLRSALALGPRPPHEVFGDELRVWDVAGYFYGRHIYPLARFSPIRSRRRKVSPGTDDSTRSKAELAG
jgi:glycosyltransferase involved in cell wall biosynthesis